MFIQEHCTNRTEGIINAMGKLFILSLMLCWLCHPYPDVGIVWV